MWLKNGTGVAIRRWPDPSRARVSSMFVSEVLRLIVARRVMGAKSYPAGGGAQQPPGPRNRNEGRPDAGQMREKVGAKGQQAARKTRDVQRILDAQRYNRRPLDEARSQPRPGV